MCKSLIDKNRFGDIQMFKQIKLNVTSVESIMLVRLIFNLTIETNQIHTPYNIFNNMV